MPQHDQSPTGSWTSAGRAGDVEGLRRMSAEINQVAEINQLKPIFYRLEAISQQYPGDTEVQSLVGEVRQRLIARGQTLMEAGQSTGQTTAAVPTTTAQTTAPRPATPPPGTPPAPPQAAAGRPATPAAGGPARPGSGPPPSFNFTKTVVVGALIGVAVFSLAIVGIRAVRRKPPPPPVIKVSFEVRSTPPGASIRVGNEQKCTANCSIELPPGDHEVQAVLDGYETGVRTVSIAQGAALPPVEFQLQPVAQALRVTTDLEGGKVKLDDQPEADLVDGSFVFDKIAPGKHSVKVTGRGGVEASFTFEAAPARAPVVEGAPTAKNLIAVIVSNFQTSAKLYSSQATLKVALDGQPVGQPGQEGLDLNNLQSGFRELTFGEGEDAQKKLISIGPAPMLTALVLRPAVTTGTLTIVTTENDVSVFVNNREQRRKTQRGSLTVPYLVAGSYRVRVMKDGFQTDAAEQSADVKKGAETKVEFQLRPVPRVATLAIRGATPGAAVLIDNNQAGTIGPDGTFTNPNMVPGEHTIEFRQGRAVKRVARMFQAGGTVELTGGDVALEKPPSRLRFAVTPSDARLTWRRSDEQPAQARPVTTPEIPVPEGSYVISATAPGHGPGTVTVQVAAGDTRIVELRLNRTVTGGGTTTPTGSVKYGMNDWEQPASFTSDAGWLIRTGGDFVLFRPTPTYGTFRFNIRLFNGPRLRWVLNYTDPRNYLLFELDDDGSFTRREVANGREANPQKITHGLRTKDFTVQIDVTPSEITHRLHSGTEWKAIDTWKVGVTQSSKFGLNIRGRDKYGLANFEFAPR